MMKRKVFLGYIVAMVLGLLSYACSQDDSSEIFNSQESDYEIVGRLHNEGLDYVLQELKKGGSLTRSKQNIVITAEEVRELCDRFVKEKGYPTEVKVTTRADNPSMDHQKLQFNFSDRQNYYLERLKKILNKAHPDRVSSSWWDKFGSTVTADGWWAMQGFLQSGSSLTPWYIIGMTAGSGIAGSVLVNL